MNVRTMFGRGLLLMVLAVMPVWGLAQSISVPFLCIEKTNGEVVKVPITETSPAVYYAISPANAAGERVRYLSVRNAWNELKIPCREVKQLTTEFETMENGLGDVNADEDIDSKDVNTIVNHLLGKPVNPYYPEPFFSAAADVNPDNKIDITDVTALIKRVLELGNARVAERFAPRREQADEEAYYESYNGQMLTINLESGNTLCSDLSMGGASPRYENGQVVWIVRGRSDRVYKITDVENIVLPTPEESLASVREALIELYNATDGEHWRNNENWCSDKPLDEWYGIETRGYPFVYHLMLYVNDIKGTLPKGLLAKIGPARYVSFGSNQLSGQLLPEEIACNLSVEDLHFHANNYTGTLSAEIFKLPNLLSFSVSENKLTGTVPEGGAYLLQYNQLGLSGNDFSGDLPADLVNHPKFHLYWSSVVPQSGHLNPPVIPGYRLDVTDMSGNKLNTTDVYADNIYTLIFNYSSARSGFTGKLKEAYMQYKSKGFEVLGMAPGKAEDIKTYLHENGIDWLNLEPKTFRDSIGAYYPNFNFINLVDNQGHIVFSSIMDDNGKLEDTSGSSTRDQEVFDVLEKKFGHIDFTPYTSTDYSRDGEVITLQEATVGNGVDVVFVGNCFVDKDMEPGGKYEQKMRQAMEQFFAYEPYTSLRERFNVYAVKAVSPNAEMYEGCTQAIMDTDDAFDYAQKVTTLIPNRPMRVNVIYNAINAGRSFTSMYDDKSYVAYMLTGINVVLNHEAGGHGIGRLYDEYVEKGGSRATDEVKEYYERRWTEYGYGANIDAHADVDETRWARLAADSRYEAENLGAYEGSNTYEYGFYRPTQNSMMRFNDTPFNAPSREAIYKNVMQESEGPSWTYDYETFVEFDAKGREEFAAAFAAASREARGQKQGTPSEVDKATLPLPPVFVKGTWQDAVKNPSKIVYRH